MKNHHLTTLFSFILFFSMFSQEKKDSSFYKNEIGFDIIPVIRIGNNAEKFQMRGFYKSAIKKNIYLRLGLQVTRYRQHFNFPPFADHYQLSSPPLDYYYNKTTRLPEYHFDLGVERRFGKKSLRYFYGADLGYSQGRTIQTGYKSNDLNLGYVSMSGHPPYLRNHNDSTLSESDLTVDRFQVSPFFGAQFIFSKHWLFTSQISYGQQFLFYRIKNFNARYPNYSGQNSYNEVREFRLENFAIRFFLCYRF